MGDQQTVASPIVKIISVWLAALGIATWSDFAAMCAAVYTLLLIGEWAWKKYLKCRE